MGNRDVLLVLTIKSLSPLPAEVLEVVREAAQTAETSLTIWIPAFLGSQGPARVFHSLQKLLSSVYTEAGRVLSARDELLLPVDVILEDLLLRAGGTRIERDGYRRVLEARHDGSANTKVEVDIDIDALYGTTAMGGTFDHLHSGHKVLFTMAAWISERRVIVGMTDDVLLGKKANRHLLESIEERRQHAEAFMKRIAPSLQIDTPALQDVYGPTAWDPDVQACVVSSESLKGAQAIDAERERKGLSKLKTFIIDVIAPDIESDDPAEREKVKMGSTAIRAWLASKPGE